MWNRPENQIKLVFIRHGAAEANMEHRYLGRTDAGLCAEGVSRLLRKKEAGYYPGVDYLFASPMKRCLETAQILYPDKEITVISDFIEMDFGVFEGKNYIELQEDERYQEWIDSNGALPFPEGESRETFIARCKQGFFRMLEILQKQMADSSCQSTKTDISVGVIVHGGTIMSLLSSFCGGDYFDYQVENGKGYICEIPYSCILHRVSSGFAVRGSLLLPPSNPADWESDNETRELVVGKE